MRVRATQNGFFGSYRYAGDEFDVPDDIGESVWFEPVEPPEPAPHSRRKREPAADPADPASA